MPRAFESSRLPDILRVDWPFHWRQVMAHMSLRETSYIRSRPSILTRPRKCLFISRGSLLIYLRFGKVLKRYLTWWEETENESSRGMIILYSSKKKGTQSKFIENNLFEVGGKLRKTTFPGFKTYATT